MTVPESVRIFVVFILLISVKGYTSKGSEKAHSLAGFDDNFLSLLEGSHYESGSVGVMRNGKLVYSKGFSLNRESKKGNPLDVSYSSSFSKLLTAAAILRLEEAGKLTLEQTVFCDGGILKEIKPWGSDDIADRRVCDITVDHLLHHSSGWDSQKSPMFDPLLNEFYVTSPSKDGVLNIGTTMNESIIAPFHIMRFMLARNLDFDPGTKTVYSNFGYSVLGRVLEAVSETSYGQYVKKSILDSCGLWHTRLGPGHKKRSKLENTEAVTAHLSTKDVYHVIGPYILDSALGWESNVIDILRFMRCLDGSGNSRLLSSHSLRKMTRQLKSDSTQKGHTWYGAGFRVNRQGVLWIEGDPQTSDMAIFHSGFTSKTYGARRHPKMSWVIKLEGNQNVNVLDKSRNLVEGVPKWPNQDLFLSDLTDFTYDKNSGFPLIKLKLSEHHLHAFVSAVKFQNLQITWFSAVSSARSTRFIVIATPAAKHAEVDYIFESGLAKETLEHHEKKFKSFGYKLTLLQSYRSRSHDSEERYACLFQKLPLDQVSHIGLQLDHKTYKDVYTKLVKDGFVPKVQSVASIRGFNVNYLFEKELEKNFKGYIGVKADDIDSKVRANAKSNRGLAYLDVTLLHGRPSFSAVFKQSSASSKWAFHTNLTEKAVHQTVVGLRGKNLYPWIIVAIPTMDDAPPKYAAYFK